MCSRYDDPSQHEAERPYRVLVETYDGDRIPVAVRAIGPKGASATAMQTAKDKGYDPVGVARVEAA